MDLKEIEQFLDENTPAFLATLGTCGNPRVRPMQSPLLVGDRIYFGTSNNKGLFKH
ncbi:pyridoxamine 5'-phosphate oxidase family protein, partial [Campylobacter coli]|nr:pyridoxamine 5'-phosphate oxidase family protein [Campylobacter coli]